MIFKSYVEGVQAQLANAGAVSYESEKTASYDADLLGDVVENNLPVDLGAIAQEGCALEATSVIADALVKMAEYDDEEAKAEIAQEAAAILYNDGLLKLSDTSPGDNNVVAGHNPGRVAAGESSARSTDHDEELSNAVDNTAHRPNYFSASPGKTGVKGGTIGSERSHPGAEGKSKQVKNNPELKNGMSNTRERPNVHGKPGHSSVGGGTIGTEKKASTLSSLLARL